nr:undecaprenyl-phosphate glucose phosphotransferase [Hyphomicrobium sp.]
MPRLKGAASPIPLHRPRLADTRHADKSSIISPVVVRGLVRAADFVVIVLLGLAIAHLYVDELRVLSTPRYLAAILITGAAVVATFELLGLYTLRVFSTFIDKMPMIALGWTVSFLALVAAIVFLKIGADVSRVWLATWYLGGTLALFAERLVMAWTIRAWARSGRLYQRAVIYGAGAVTADVIAKLEADSDSIVRIAGIFDERAADRAPRQIAGYPRLGGLTELLAMSRVTRLDLIIVAIPLAAEDRLANVVRRISILPADIKMPARATALRFSPRTYSHVGSVAMIDLYDKPI